MLPIPFAVTMLEMGRITLGDTDAIDEAPVTKALEAMECESTRPITLVRPMGSMVYGIAGKPDSSSYGNLVLE
jgi:hypothetical protein